MTDLSFPHNATGHEHLLPNKGRVVVHPTSENIYVFSVYWFLSPPNFGHPEVLVSVHLALFCLLDLVHRRKSRRVWPRWRRCSALVRMLWQEDWPSAEWGEKQEDQKIGEKTGNKGERSKKMFGITLPPDKTTYIHICFRNDFLKFTFQFHKIDLGKKDNNCITRIYL